MDDNGIAELRNSLKNKNQYAFEIHGKNYESSAYMMRLENSGLILVQAFPVEATNKLNATANKETCNYFSGIFHYLFNRNGCV